MNLNENAMVLDGLDAAIVGSKDGLLVYSDEKIINVLIEENSWHYEDALEWLSFNIHGLVGNTGCPYFID